MEKRLGSTIWKKTYNYFALNQEEFMGHYHPRSNVGRTFSMIKAKFSEMIKSKTKMAQTNELLCKLIGYNLTVLISEMYGLGISVDLFCSESSPFTQIVL